MNKSLKLNVSILVFIFAVSGIIHGFFEFLQGNTRTEGMFIAAIGDAWRMWPHGHEWAFTLISNFRITGIVTMIIGLGIFLWPVVFIQKKNGSIILLLLFITSVLTGGGVAQTLFFPWICLAAGCINKPLDKWKNRFKPCTQNMLASAWHILTGLTVVSISCTLIIAVTGFFPGIKDPDEVSNIMLIVLLVFTVSMPVSFICAIARDLGKGTGIISI